MHRHDTRDRLERTALRGLALGALAFCACTDEPSGAPDGEAEDRVWLSDLEEGLLLHYDFDAGHTLCVGTACSVLDMSGNGRHGDLQGPTQVNSPWGEARNFDGVNDWISIANPPDSPALYGGVQGGFTISVRVRVDDADKWNRLCTGCVPIRSMNVGSPTGGRVVRTALRDVVHGGDHVHESATTIPEGTWTTITLVAGGGGAGWGFSHYYFDCESEGYIQLDADIGLHDYGASSIAQGWNAGSWFDGRIDDLRIWDRALSDDEIRLLCLDPAEAACSGAPEAAGLGIDKPDPPDPPANSLPCTPVPGVVACVSNSDQLYQAVDEGVPDVYLANGTYDHASLFAIHGVHNLPIAGQRLWARGESVVLEFGIDAGGPNAAHAGPEIHGLHFDIHDALHGANGGVAGTEAAFRSWGSATNAVIEDCTIDGNGVLPGGVWINALEGLEIRRVEVRDVLQFGIDAEDPGDTPLAAPMLIEHVSVHDVGDPSLWPGYSGTGQIGIQLGDLAILSHAFVRDVRWGGINVGTETDGTVMEYIDVDRIGVGHEDEEFPGGKAIAWEMGRNSELRNFCVGPMTSFGVHAEWDHNGPPACCNPMSPESPCMNGEVCDCGQPGEPTCEAAEIRNAFHEVHDGVVESSFIGVHFDNGTIDSSVHDVVLRNYSRAGVAMYNNVTSEAQWPDYDDGGTQFDNDFQEPQLFGFPCDFTRTHVNQPLVCE